MKTEDQSWEDFEEEANIKFYGTKGELDIASEDVDWLDKSLQTDIGDEAEKEYEEERKNIIANSNWLMECQNRYKLFTSEGKNELANTWKKLIDHGVQNVMNKKMKKAKKESMAKTIANAAKADDEAIQKAENVEGLYKQIINKYGEKVQIEANPDFDVIIPDPKKDEKLKWDYKDFLDTSIWGSDYKSTKTKKSIDLEEYEKLVANQKPTEWSDDVVLIDINRMTAWMLDGTNGLESESWYDKHKKNDLTDEQFDLWDNTYQKILKFRSNE